MPLGQRESFLTEITALFKYKATRLTTEEDIIMLLREAETKTDGATLLNREQYEQISETDLLTSLSDGWQIVHKLENGNLIVKR